jgi:hypothetical protein
MTLYSQRHTAGLISLVLMLLPTWNTTVNGFQATPPQSWARTTSRTSSLESSSYQYYSHLRMSTSNKQEQSSSSTSISTSTKNTRRLPGTAQLDVPWQELGFEFRPTHSHIKLVYKDDGTGWGEPELVQGEPYINVHIGATALHYGQSCFEG